MTTQAISARGLGKQYRIAHGTPGASYFTMRDAIVAGVKQPIQRLLGLAPPAVTHENFWALQDVSFDIAPGEIVGIVGRNGAGKSTLLKILSRITRPTSGSVEIRGRVGSLLEVGTGFHRELTGRENIYLNGSLLGMKRAEIDRQFDAIVAFAEVEQFLDTPVKRYSSGMYIRLAFAVAAHLEPEILIIDEVLAVGDAAFQKKCLGRIQQVGNSGRTVIFVSHNADVVANLCSKVILLRSGRIHNIGTSDEILLDYYADVAESKTGEYDLAEHAGRPRHLSPWLSKVRLTDLQGRGCSHFVARDSMTFAVTVKPPRPLTDARVTVIIEDHLGRRLFTVANYQSSAEHWQMDQECTAKATIRDLRLGTGRYMFSVYVSTQAEGLLDMVEHCGWFDVEAVNCYGNGVPYSPTYGPVLETAEWTLQP